MSLILNKDLYLPLSGWWPTSQTCIWMFLSLFMCMSVSIVMHRVPQTSFQLHHHRNCFLALTNVHFSLFSFFLSFLPSPRVAIWAQTLMALMMMMMLMLLPMLYMFWERLFFLFYLALKWFLDTRVVESSQFEWWQVITVVLVRKVSLICLACCRHAVQ